MHLFYNYKLLFEIVGSALMIIGEKARETGRALGCVAQLGHSWSQVPKVSPGEGHTLDTESGTNGMKLKRS